MTTYWDAAALRNNARHNSTTFKFKQTLSCPARVACAATVRSVLEVDLERA
jgi:hypothetical protein